MVKKCVTSTHDHTDAATPFCHDSVTYYWTNESLADLKSIGEIEPNERVLTIAVSGDSVCFFASVGARIIDALDISQYALMWAEIKYQALRSLSYENFITLFMSMQAKWEDIPRTLHLSGATQHMLDTFHGSIAQTESVFDQTDLYRQHDSSALYNTSAQTYKISQENAHLTTVTWYKSDLYHFLNTYYQGNPYALIYISNVLDHVVFHTFNNTHAFEDRKQRTLIIRALQEVLISLSNMLDPEKGMILLNIQFHEKPLPLLTQPLIEEALHLMGYTLQQIPKTVSGGGEMYQARKLTIS